LDLEKLVAVGHPQYRPGSMIGARSKQFDHAPYPPERRCIGHQGPKYSVDVRFSS